MIIEFECVILFYFTWTLGCLQDGPCIASNIKSIWVSLAMTNPTKAKHNIVSNLVIDPSALSIKPPSDYVW